MEFITEVFSFNAREVHKLHCMLMIMTHLISSSMRSLWS